MGQVDDAHDAKDQCQYAGYKKKQQAVLHCIKALNQKYDLVHVGPLLGLQTDRKRVVEGTRVSARVDLGGRRSSKKKRTRDKRRSVNITERNTISKHLKPYP